jgi:hypothetical protein
MRRMGAGMTAVVLLAGLAASSASAQDTDGDLHSATPQPKAWWDGWFTPAAKPDKHEVKKSEPAVTPAPVAPSPIEAAAVARQRERADLNRRMEVCNRLTEIAVQNNDAAMKTQSDQLLERAWDLYQQRTAALPASGSSPEEAPLDRPRSSKPFSTGHLLGRSKAEDEASVVREVKP